MSSNSLGLEGLLAITLIFSSFHRFSIGLKSGLWLGRCKMFLSANHFLTTFAVCFGSLLCWNVLWCPWPSFSADCLMLLRILLYCSFFMVPFTMIRVPDPLAEKHPQTIRFPPSCLTMGMAFLGGRLLLFYSKWRIHHCGQTVTFLFHLTIKQETRSRFLCPDEHLQRPSRLLCALSGEWKCPWSVSVEPSSVQCLLNCLSWDVTTSSVQIHQDGLLILLHLSHYPPAQHRYHIFHSAERLVFF